MNEPWPWPPELDAVIAAPRHHRLVFENEQVRVLDTRISVGDTVPVHTHRWPAVYNTVRFSHFIRRDGEGNILFDSRTLATPLPRPHGSIACRRTASKTWATSRFI